MWNSIDSHCQSTWPKMSTHWANERPVRTDDKIWRKECQLLQEERDSSSICQWVWINQCLGLANASQLLDPPMTLESTDIAYIYRQPFIFADAVVLPTSHSGLIHTGRTHTDWARSNERWETSLNPWWEEDKDNDSRSHVTPDSCSNVTAALCAC